MRSFARHSLFLALALSFAPLAPRAALAQACLPPAEARNAAAAARVTPLSALRARLAAQAGGEVVSAQLCQGPNGSLVYFVNILTSRGVVVSYTVDAVTGAILK